METVKMLLVIFVISAILRRSDSARDTGSGLSVYVTDTDSRLLMKLLVNVVTTDEESTNTTGSPYGIGFDPETEQIYWFEHYPSSIKRADVNLEKITLVTRLPVDVMVHSLAVEVKSRKLYFSDYYYSKIGSMDLTGENPEIIFDSTVVRGPSSIIVHSDRRQIIWSENGDVPSIRSANYDGSDTRTIVSTSGTSWGLAVDSENGILYWSEYQTRLIQSVSLDGSNRREFYHHASNGVYALFLLDTTLYFTAEGDRLHGISVDGGEAKEISDTKFRQPFGLYVLPHKADGVICERDPGAVENNNEEPTTSNVVLLVGAVVGAVVGTLVVVLLVLVCLCTQGRLQCVSPDPVSVDKRPMDVAAGQQESANVLYYSNTSSNIYHVLDTDTKAGEKEYEVLKRL